MNGPEKRLNNDGEVVSGLVFAFGNQIEDFEIVFLDKQLDGGIVLARSDVLA